MYLNYFEIWLKTDFFKCEKKNKQKMFLWNKLNADGTDTWYTDKKHMWSDLKNGLRNRNNHKSLKFQSEHNQKNKTRIKLIVHILVRTSKCK